MIKISYVIAGLGIGGAERMLVDLVLRLDTKRYVVEVIYTTPPSQASEQMLFVAQLQQAGISVVHIPKKSRCGFGFKRALMHHFRLSAPDIVHTHLFPADVWGAAAAHALSIPTISTEHSTNPDEGYIKRYMKSVTHRYRVAVVAISKAVEESVRAIAPASSVVHLIPNGIDTTHFSFQPQKPSKPPHQLLVVGRLEPAKGHIHLLRALPHVQRSVHLTIVGDGSLRDDLERLTTRLGLRGIVDFVGAHSDVLPFYRAADVVLIPSNWEGQCLVALEAMASGVPVIASAVDGLRDVIAHHRTGVLVDVKDPEIFAKAIDRVLDDPAFTEQLCLAARADVEARYSVESMVQSYQELYEDIADQ